MPVIKLQQNGRIPCEVQRSFIFMQAFRAPSPATIDDVCGTRADGYDGATVRSIPDFAVIVPMHNEEASVETLVAEIVAACQPVGRFEIVVVDDASSDRTAEAVLALGNRYPMLRLVRHDRQGGQSAAIHSGVQAARAPVICMLDGDGQNPRTICPRFLHRCSPPMRLAGSASWRASASAGAIRLENGSPRASPMACGRAS